MRFFTFKLMVWTWINNLTIVKAINTLQAWYYILFSHQEVHSEHNGQRRSAFIKTNYQLFVSLVVSCLQFSAQFSQATSKLCGFQLVKLSRKAELISNTTGYVPPREKQASVQQSPFKRKEAAAQKAQGVCRVFTTPRPTSRLPSAAKLSDTVLNSLATTILSYPPLLLPASSLLLLC